MDDTALPSVVSRPINVNSAIDRSSFQLPVLVAISAKNADDQIVQLFATARDVFAHIFAFRIDRLRERLSADKIEKLVPASARLHESLDVEYVLIVRAKAIFWFSGNASNVRRRGGCCSNTRASWQEPSRRPSTGCGRVPR